MNLAALLILQAGGGGLGGMLILFLPMIAIMYFLVFLPQQRQRKRMQEMHSTLKNGDKVITSSGIYGVINGMDGDTIILKIADNVKIRIARAAIAQVEASEDAK
ncbi:MAG TPA: preprotein translocase subunit YajC [Candidatus Limnocylindrales bacterium]|nr:preprotein translocase subunit YajC [Candidatus Limnocylindrales bacterium]